MAAFIWKMADPAIALLEVAEIIEVAKESAAEHFYLERDLTPSPETTLNNSFAYLKSRV